MGEVVANLIDIREEYEQYQELCVASIPFKYFKQQWLEYNHEKYLEENPDEPLSFKSFKKRYYRSLYGENKIFTNKKLVFEIKLSYNDKTIYKRNHYVPLDFVITEEKLKKVSLMIDDFIYPENETDLITLNIIIMFKLDDNILSYEMPAMFRRGDKIDIRPIQKDIFDYVLDKKGSE